MRADGVSLSLAGSQVNRSKQQVDDMLSPDGEGRVYSAADLLLIGDLSPSLRRAVNDYWGRNSNRHDGEGC
jgi:hypothetical protein